MNPRRLWVVALVLVAGGLTVVARAVEITVIEGEVWRGRAQRQHEQVIEVPGPRGGLRSSDGYVLATSIDRVAIQTNTGLLADPEVFARAAAPLVGLDGAELADRLDGAPRAVWLAKSVARELGEAVRGLAPTAVVLVPDFERVYPLGSLAAPVVGFVGREELRMVGRAGLEHHYDELLSGDPQTFLAINDAIQRKVRLERVERGQAGYELELSLNARIQAVCETELERARSELGADAASAVVLDPRSGALLALASIPSFDPGAPGLEPPEHWRLRPVQDAIEPGSTVKPVVAAAALATDSVRLGERFDCFDRGTRLAGYWIRDHVDPGSYTIDEVVAYSANTGIIEIAERINADDLHRTFDAFGFGSRSGIDFPAEARGLMPAVADWSKLSRAGFALGQELTVTPLQMALAYAVIANGGWLIEPWIVGCATAPDDVIPTEGSVRSRVLDADLAARLTAMLEAVIVDGTGDEARVPGYRVAGKTGTAQLAVDGSFDDEHHVAWFAGFLPLPDPRLVIVVAVENPRADFWASTAAAPVFARIAEAAAGHLDLPAASSGGRGARIDRGPDGSVGLEGGGA